MLNEEAVGAAYCGPEPSTQEGENTKEGACCSPSNTNHINTETMGKAEQTIKKPVAASECCGGAPATNEDACCALDEQKKAEGEAGCGCSSALATHPEASPASSCC